jgi:hypothetical protein
MKDSTTTLQWTNERPEGTDEAVIADIATSLGDLKSPEDLFYHTVFLCAGSMETSPGVIVVGERGNPNFVCTYYPIIDDAFETMQPNLDPKVVAMAQELGLDELSSEELWAVKEFVDDAIATGSPDEAVRVFLRGRGGQKAVRSDEDFPLGHNAVQRRIDEAEQQDKGA